LNKANKTISVVIMSCVLQCVAEMEKALAGSAADENTATDHNENEYKIRTTIDDCDPDTIAVADPPTN